ncbi:MAG: hypothetical protein Q9159_005991, partial [Coniocarpon cinnabarinum]
MADDAKTKDTITEDVMRVDSAVSSPTLDIRVAEKGLENQSTEQDPPMTIHRFMPLVAMAFLWTGSQIPLYLFGAIPPYNQKVYQDLGGADRWTWFVLGNLLALASICPFVGSLSDLFGRRYVALIGASFLILGMIVASTAHSMNVFIGGMALSGIGAGINELTALAVTSEIAPTRKRGVYNSLMILTIVPFCPSQLWGQLVASRSSWRFIGLWCGLWAFVGLVLTVLFYHPPPRQNSVGLSRREILGRIDYVGGILSVGGMLLFMMGLQWGGYNYPWTSSHVLTTLILGAILILCFFLWESKYATYPMFPSRLRQESRTLTLTLVITAISGASFFSIILFWPTQSYNVYGHDPVAVGVRNLSLGFSILAGACIILALLSFTKGRIRELLLFSCVLMTAGTGGMAALRTDNLWLVYVVITIAGFGIGGIVVPAAIISNIVCPDDLIATVTALTLAIRVIGGAIGYAIYYNVFYNKFVSAAQTQFLVPAAMKVLDPTGVPNPQETLKETVVQIVELTAAGLLPAIRQLPGVQSEGAYEVIVAAGQETFAYAYKYVYYVSLAFGGVSIICAAFLGDIR